MGSDNADGGFVNAHEDRAAVAATVRSNEVVGLAMVTIICAVDDGFHGGKYDVRGVNDAGAPPPIQIWLMVGGATFSTQQQR
jgi:hypothetical protein